MFSFKVFFVTQEDTLYILCEDDLLVCEFTEQYFSQPVIHELENVDYTFCKKAIQAYAELYKASQICSSLIIPELVEQGYKYIVLKTATVDYPSRLKAPLLASKTLVPDARIKSIDKTTGYIDLQIPIIVSVIIPSYNYGRYLSECVSSVMTQSYKQFEVIIVNDGSTDNTVEICKNILSQYSEKKLMVIHQTNTGEPAISRNQGIALSTGSFILCLDADDKISSNFLETAVNLLNSSQAYSIAYPVVQEFDGGKNQWPPFDYDPHILMHWNFIPVASLFRKKVWEDAHGYAEGIKGHEDWDFWIKAAENGYFGILINSAVFYYRIHQASLLTEASQGGDLQRNKLKAQLVLGHANLYSDIQQEWAQRVLWGEYEAQTVSCNISQVPYFDAKILSPACEKVIQNWYSLKNQAFQLKQLLHRNYRDFNHQYWARNAEGWQEQKGEVLDIHPFSDSDLPSLDKFKTLWIPSMLFHKLQPSAWQEQMKDIIEVRPRFCILPEPELIGNLDLERSHRMILRIDTTELWQPILTHFLDLFSVHDDVITVLFSLDESEEICYEKVSTFLEAGKHTEDTMADLCIMAISNTDLKDFIFNISPTLTISPLADFATEILSLDTLALQQSVLSTTNFSEYTSLLNTKTFYHGFFDQLIQNILEKEDSLFLIKPLEQFVTHWNQYVLEKMM